MKRFVLLAAMCSALLTGCIKEKTIDARDEESLKSSISAIQGDLSDSQKKDFEEAVQLLVFSELQNKGGIFALAAQDPEDLASDLYKSLDGKSASEVIKLAEEQKQNLKRKQLQSIEQEIADLAKRKSEANKTADVLAKIEITNPKFYWTTEYYSKKPVIDFTITNNTDTAIARGFFHGTVASPGRTIPWVSQAFNYEFKGGLEPGETKTLQLAPNMFGDWAVPETRDRDDIVMTIDIVNAENAEGENIAASFGEKEAERLETLLEEKQKLMLELN